MPKGTIVRAGAAVLRSKRRLSPKKLLFLRQSVDIPAIVFIFLLILLGRRTAGFFT